MPPLPIRDLNRSMMFPRQLVHQGKDSADSFSVRAVNGLRVFTRSRSQTKDAFLQA